MNFDKILSALRTGVAFAEQIVPTIAQLTPLGGIAETAIKAVGAITETVENVQKRIEEGELVARTTDQQEVRALAQRLHDLNDQIAAQIDAT